MFGVKYGKYFTILRYKMHDFLYNLFQTKEHRETINTAYDLSNLCRLTVAEKWTTRS